MHKTEVLLTIDTEFSIAGALDSSHHYSPIADPVVCGSYQGKEQGLGFMLDTFQQFDTKAVFFVEAINSCHFGLEPMGRFVERISPYHDIQLHTHPVWSVFDKDSILRDRALFPVNDSLLDRTDKQIDAILEIGIKTFNKWGLPKPVAIRTGSLFTEENLYPCFARHGFRWSSSVGVGIYQPMDESLQLEYGHVTLSGVTEIPVTSFSDMPHMKPNHRKTLQITSCSWPEIRAVLDDAHRHGLERVVILMHPFEFFKRRDFRFNKLRPNRVNQRRLQKLCRYLDENRDRFESTDFRSMSTVGAAENNLGSLSSMNDFLAVGRMAHNKFNDWLWWY